MLATKESIDNFLTVLEKASLKENNTKEMFIAGVKIVKEIFSLAEKKDPAEIVMAGDDNTITSKIKVLTPEEDFLLWVMEEQCIFMFLAQAVSFLSENQLKLSGRISSQIKLIFEKV